MFHTSIETDSQRSTKAAARKGARVSTWAGSGVVESWSLRYASVRMDKTGQVRHFTATEIELAD